MAPKPTTNTTTNNVTLHVTQLPNENGETFASRVLLELRDATGSRRT
jgi:REP element-mobilizing transposase RayT